MRPGYSDLMVERIVLSDAEALAEFRTTIMGLKGLCTYGFGLEVKNAFEHSRNGRCLFVVLISQQSLVDMLK